MLAEFTIEEQVDLEKGGEDGWWPCDEHDDCTSPEGVAVGLGKGCTEDAWRKKYGENSPGS